MSFLWFFVQENIFQTGKQFKCGTFYIYFTFLYWKQKDDTLLIQKLEKCLTFHQIQIKKVASNILLSKKISQYSTLLLKYFLKYETFSKCYQFQNIS